MRIVFTCDLERQRADHDKTLENEVKHYRKNIIAIDKIDSKCDQDVANLTYLSAYLFENFFQVAFTKILLRVAAYFCTVTDTRGNNSFCTRHGSSSEKKYN